MVRTELMFWYTEPTKDEAQGVASMNSSSPWVWIDDKIVDADQAQVSVFDHGFLYGDSIYESLRTYNQRVFRFGAHFNRLTASAESIGLTLPWTRKEVEKILQEVIRFGPEGQEVGIRLMVTRGVGPLGIDPTRCTKPSLIIFGWAISRGPHPQAKDGVEVVISSIRRNPPSALDPCIKSGNFLNNILAFRDCLAVGAYEAILCTVDGHVAEGTTSNVFWVRNEEVFTSQDEGILLGVTRELVLEILEDLKFPHRRGSFPPEALQQADEAFITSTFKGILPVSVVNERRFELPGRVTQRISEEFQRRVEVEEGGE